MKFHFFVSGLFLLVLSSSAFAAEKSRSLVQIDAANAAIEALAPKIGANKDAAGALDDARNYIKKAADSFEQGRALFGLGDVKPEALQDISHYTALSETATSIAASRLEKARGESELEQLETQLTAVKVKVKIFEDRKSEFEKLKTEVARCQTFAKDIENLKMERDQLAGQVKILQTDLVALETIKKERDDLVRKIEEFKAKNAEALTRPAAPEPKPKPLVTPTQTEESIKQVSPADKTAVAPPKAATVVAPPQSPEPASPAPAMDQPIMEEIQVPPVEAPAINGDSAL